VPPIFEAVFRSEQPVIRRTPAITDKERKIKMPYGLLMDTSGSISFI
jgi:hypothetical protein